jgi:glycine cleavage system H lipoate-binding protein
MVALLLIVSIAAMIALDYFVFQKRRAAREAAEPIDAPGLRPLSEVFRRLPGGVFLQPTYTWSRIREDGEVLIGLHPMLYGLVGAPYQLQLIHEGRQVEKGAPIIRIGREERWLTVRSPIAGTVTDVNHVVEGETDWSGVQDADGGWLYRLRPVHIADEVPSWFIGDRAVAWTRDQYARLRSRLAGVAMARSLGAVMADGGEIPTGILGELDEQAWRTIQDEFLGS